MQQSFNTLQQQLLEKGQVLKKISCDEHAFSKMESHFYDILALARLQKDGLAKEMLLAQLQIIKAEKFQLTQQPYNKARQRELVICQFKSALVKVLASYSKAVHKTNSVCV